MKKSSRKFINPLSRKLVRVTATVKKENKLSTVLSGVAGEYYVAAELSKRGYIASITLRNSKGVDILCSNEETFKTASIQVKTNKRSNRKWILGEKSEKEYSKDLFYVFVCLNDNERHPDFFIVPSEIVANTIHKNNQDFINFPGKKGQKRNENSIRNFLDKEEKYLNRWDLLKI